MKYWDSWKELESAVYKIVVLTYPAYARVRIKPGKNGIAVPGCDRNFSESLHLYGFSDADSWPNCMNVQNANTESFRNPFIANDLESVNKFGP